MLSIQLTSLVIVLIGSYTFLQVTADNVTTSLIERVLSGNDVDNVMFSPYLVRESLMQLYLGADENTAQEIEKMLQISSDVSKNKIINGVIKSVVRFKKPRYGTLKKASRIYVAQNTPVKQEYEEKYKEYFNTSVGQVDFGNLDSKISEIRNWIKMRTSVKIGKVINEINNETKIMQISAMFFKAKWKDPFLLHETKIASFYIPLKTGGFYSTKVNTMTRKGKYEYSFIEKLNAYSIQIPYENPVLKMIILLPKAMDGVTQMVQKLGSLSLDDIEPHDMTANFRITLPKFKLANVVKVKEALRSLGIKDLFQNANLNGMTNSNGLQVYDILQKIYVEVDESSKSDSINMLDFGSISRQFVAEVNHPFVFLIKDSKTVYIAGRINKFK